MEEHDDASLMLGGEEHHHHGDESQHDEIHHEEHEEDDHHMDIEPNRIEGVSRSGTTPTSLERDDFWDHEPTKDEIWEMKKANKRPSEWLKLLCKEWAESDENLELIETVDAKFQAYKPYLKGKISSQLLCRLCIPSSEPSLKNSSSSNNNTTSSAAPDAAAAASTTSPTKSGNSKPDFLQSVLNIQDEFDKTYVISQVERFCDLYDIRGRKADAAASAAAAAAPSSPARFALPNNEATTAAAVALYGDLAVNAALGSVSDVQQQALAAAVAAANQSPQPTPNPTQAGGIAIPPHFLSADATAAAVAAAQAAAAAGDKRASTAEAAGAANSTAATQPQIYANSRAQQAALTKEQQRSKNLERTLEQERRQNMKKEQKLNAHNKKLAKKWERESLQKQKAAEKLAREQAREEKRNRKLLQRQERERFAQEQKEAALRRAAELVASNRVPIEITRAGGYRGRGTKKHNSLPTVKGTSSTGGDPKATNASGVPKKRQRSAIVVSTASDLDRIVTHSQNLWTKYNAIAKEHNQRVNWITVAKELGIHVKVREKYARMHSRACQRNFDFAANGHWKIKDHPEIFQEPTPAEQKARMPPPLPPPTATTDATEVKAEPEGGSSSHATVLLGEQQQPSGQALSQEPATEAQAEPLSVAAASESSCMVPQVTHDPLQATMASGAVVAGAAASHSSTPNPVAPATPQDHHHHLGISNSVDAAAAAATAAAVVDAAGVGGAAIDINHVVELTAAATATTAAAASGAPVSDGTPAGGGEIQSPPEGITGDTRSANDRVRLDIV